MKINLANFIFTDKPTLIAENGEFKAVGFRYSTGVEALKVSNRRGSFTILPWMGQMIWRCDFDGRELAMKSMYDEPKDCKACFNESYGCFMMHCGLTAMGNPTAEDTHVGHAELPVIRYKEAYLEFGADKDGAYVAVGGTCQHDMCFTYNYLFSPRVVLRKGAAKLEISATAKNLKDLPFEYYYLCHVNHRPVDGSKIVESPLAKKPSRKKSASCSPNHASNQTSPTVSLRFSPQPPAVSPRTTSPGSSTSPSAASSSTSRRSSASSTSPTARRRSPSPSVSSC